MKTAGLAGVFPVLSTPFGDDGAIDLDALDNEVEWLRANGVDGVTVAMVSEVLRLTDDERRSVTAQVCRAAAEGVPTLPVVISVGASSVGRTIALAEHAEAVGATAVMVIPPPDGVPDDRGLIEFFAAVVESVSLPVVVQDASSYVGEPIPLRVYQALLDRFGAARLLAKPEAQPIGPRLTALREASHGQLRVFEGLGGLALLDAYPRGVAGTMPGPEVPWAIVALWAALVEGRLDDADAIHARLAALLSLQSSLESYVAIEKHLLVAQDVLPTARRRYAGDYELDAATAALSLRLLDRLREAVDAVADRHEPTKGED